MKRVLGFALLLLLFCSFVQAENVLWVFPEPSDDFYFAPMIGDVCVEQGNNCLLLYLSNGSKMEECHLSIDRCDIKKGDQYYDLSDLMQSNMVSVSEYYRSDYKILNWDFRELSLPFDNLIDLIDDEVREFEADKIYSFNPYHGTDCSQENILAASALQKLIDRGYPENQVFHLDTARALLLNEAGGPKWIGFVPFQMAPLNPYSPLSSTVRTYDAENTWRYLSDVVHLHLGFFPSDVKDAYAAGPLDVKRLFFVDNGRLLSGYSEAYTYICRRGNGYLAIDSGSEVVTRGGLMVILIPIGLIVLMLFIAFLARVRSMLKGEN